MSFLESKDLHECHVNATQKCLEEFESLTIHDINFNMENKWMEIELRNIYSSYLILNQQHKENNELTFKEKIKIIINPSEFLKERIQNNILEQFKYAKLKYSFSSPFDLLNATVFVASLVFYLFVSYVMVFVGVLGKCNVSFVFVFSSICKFFNFSFILISKLYSQFLKKAIDYYYKYEKKT